MQYFAFSTLILIYQNNFFIMFKMKLAEIKCIYVVMPI